MTVPTRRVPGVALVAAIGTLTAIAAPPAPSPDPQHRLSGLTRDIARLRAERQELESKENGLLGDLAKLDAALTLATAQRHAVDVRLTEARSRRDALNGDLAALAAVQKSRAPYVAARLREIYKRGPQGLLAQAVSPVKGGDATEGLRYASYLARRDATQFSAWRDTGRRLAAERLEASGQAKHLEALEQDASRAESEIAATQRERSDLLGRIRGDREQHDRALSELEAAASGLGKVVDALGASPAPPALDVRSFRGLFDWPAPGPVSSGFGRTVHPKFLTIVPHPGLDIDAPDGAPFRTVFDGTVAYAATLHGYGLTAIVDHGNGILTVYAHAGVLLGEAGRTVQRGQELGRVGESGSLRGPYLYFELRDGGKPVDPIPWLRRR